MPRDKRAAAGGYRTAAKAPAGMRGRTPRSTAAIMALALLLTAGASGPSAAQRSNAPRISVAPTILAEPASQAALSIQVGPPDALPSNTFVRVRGLPGSVSLSEGYAIAPGSWAVPLFGLPSLKAIVPAGVSGRSEITIHLVGVDGTTLAETKTALVVGPANIIAPAERAPPEGPQPNRPRQRASNLTPAVVPPGKLERNEQPRGTVLPPDVKERAERLVANGDRHLDQGNIGAARMFFQRAAEAGLAAGALKMAATYDPGELDRLGIKVQGAILDRAEARKWYERARTLGAPEAEDRLARIGGS